MQTGEVFFARHEGLVVLKFVGQIRYTMGGSYRISAALDAFLDTLFEKKDFSSILIDLAQTESIDSTNLGLLARIARFAETHLGHKVTIISTNEDVNTILESVGFDQIFLIVRDPNAPMIDFESIPAREDALKELDRVILDAHKTLIEICETNRDKFSKVVEILETQMREKEDRHSG